MIRICSTLAHQGYTVTLVGRELKESAVLQQQAFIQKRLYCFFTKGPLFYAEYNLRLFFWLLFQKADCICAIDLDTILPCLFASQLKGTKRVYDAHELFCEMKEIITRPSRYKMWKWIEQFAVPKFKHGYTVCEPIADEFEKMYGVKYEVVRNVPFEKKSKIQIPRDKEQETSNYKPQTFLLYQGAVNEGRSFETLIPAMKHVEVPLHIYGDGNFMEQTKKLIKANHLQDKVLLKGKIKPAELKEITETAYAGITLFENNGLSNYLSLANRFFDYIQAGTPQLCVDYPAYRQINDRFGIALLIPDTTEESISKGLNLLLTDAVLYAQLKENCKQAAAILNWQEEEKILIQFYKKLLG
ncbi:glycosyltransferase [Lacibacter sediminis]|uniref:Glycosyltransferase n=2 Tax=Lacibacter sediminis TaxID=2760713 RepID=A0A7G5XMU5_9BACT|nr:glycosyltransferase [Lacibacter sediminis]